MRTPGLFRVAHKMATGTGKTVVMAMLVAWHTLNKATNPRDRRFSDAFLVVAPGITIRDRLRVLLPSDPDNYYRLRDIVPPDRVGDLGRAKIVITNFHGFQLRENVKAPKLTKEIAGQRPGVFTETPDEMVCRVTRELGTKRNIVVINDEAHHCYRRRVGADDTGLESLSGEDKREAAKRDEEARVWLTGLQAVAAKTGVRVVYDLSATPFYLRGSGWPEGTLFQWVVSDFSLIDAIEAGLVKVPRVPVDDNSAQAANLPTYRGLWLHIRDDLPKKGRKTDAIDGQEPSLPAALEGALQSLYGNYEKAFRRWEDTASGIDGSTPPVFIVVCNNTNVSKLVFDYIAGWEKPLPGDTSVVVPGKLDLFSNAESNRWSARPKTILVDSTQLDSGEAMSAEFKAAAVTEIEEFKAELRQRFPGRDVEELTDEDLLREVMNAVGKPDNETWPIWNYVRADDRWPFGNSNASNATSSTPSGSGQLSPARSARRTWSPAVVNGTPNAAPTWRRGKPSPRANRRISRTLRMARRGLGTSHLLGADSEAGWMVLSAHTRTAGDPLKPVRKPPESLYGIDRNRCTETSGIRTCRQPRNARSPRDLVPNSCRYPVHVSS